MTNSKDPAISLLLDRLDLSARKWVVVDHWEGDRCATGVAAIEDPRQLVYVSTFGEVEDKYSYECEMPANGRRDEFTVTESGENVSFSELVAVITRHLTGGTSTVKV